MKLQVILNDANVNKDFFASNRKENNLKCPFCNEKLVRHFGMEKPELYCCDNPKCSRGGVATEQSWQELITTRKALDYATETLTRISISPETMLEPEKIVPQLAGQALEQIESITKGGDNE